MKEHTFKVDNITWNDLSLDDIYSRLNSCVTSAGEDCLKDRLGNPYIESCEEFEDISKLIDEVDGLKKNDKLDKLNQMLTGISKLKNYNFSEEIRAFSSEEKKNNTKHYIIDFLVIISFMLIFVYPGPGIVAFFIMIAYAVSDYFKTKNIIASKLTVFNYLIRILNSVKKSKLKLSDSEYVYSKKVSRLYELTEVFAPFMRGTFIISEGAKVTSNPLSILFDYVRMIFHIDIIKYNSMIDFVKSHTKETLELYSIVGDLDLVVAIDRFKNEVGELCKPEFVQTNSISITDGYHPLLNNPVTNSIDTDWSVLITGCNASGKSTFLKMTTICALFAQCFGFTFAKEYKAPFFRIYSSMALRDDLSAGESYFVSEIKSLKRIVDDIGNDSDNSSVLCVIDEVLRGTNTVERIAASVEILKSIAKDNVLCFAATHDIELTELLMDSYRNFHFTEVIMENDIEFSYKLIEGAATSRNAIRLLSVLGYDEKIVEKAEKRADEFVNNGVWK